MKHKLFLISSAFFLGFGSVVVLFIYGSHLAQATAEVQDWPQSNINISAKGLSTNTEKVEVIVTETYTTFLPCVMKVCLPVFSDDFSNPDSGWGSESGTDYSVGYYEGEYRITLNPGWWAWSLQDFGTSNFQVELDAWPAPSYPYGVGGIVFNADDYGFYLFEISNGYYSLWSIDWSTWNGTDLVSWTYLPSVIYPGYATNHLKVIRNGSAITIYANNQLLNTVSDNTYHGTRVGMMAGFVIQYETFDQRFDNFKLYTGSCIGVQGNMTMENRSSNFGAIQMKQVSEFAKP